MKIVSGYYVFLVYRTYKAHFNSPTTDIKKYKFNVFNIPYNQFIESKTKHYCDRIAKRIKTERDVTLLLISAFKYDSSLWIGLIADELDKYIDLKEEHENTINNMPYIFKEDCLHLLKSGMKFNDEMGEFALKQLLDSKIKLESFIVLKKIFNFNLDSNSNYVYIYKVKYTKYEWLLSINTPKYKKILEEAIMIFRGLNTPNNKQKCCANTM